MAEKLVAQKVPTLVVIAAEAYKRHGSPFATGPLYGGHFERVGIYDDKLVDLVISDDRTDPASWQRVLQRRLRTRRRSAP